MDVDARKEFWKELLKAREEKDIAMVNSKIICPKKIYRYRSVSVRALNALAENKLYFSTSNYYDDPFDTFIHLDYKKIEEGILKNYNSGTKIANRKEIEKKLKNYKELRNTIKSSLWSVCFSESYDNEILWLKYAEKHEGVSLEYKFEDLYGQQIETTFCWQKSNRTHTEKNNIFAYPVVYLNQVYDATDFAKTILECDIDDIENKISDVWELEKILLLKREVHYYDYEWRLILGKPYYNKDDDKLSIYAEVKPTKVILGMKISEDDKKAVLMAAERAGIEKIEQMTINDHDEFVAQRLK